MPPPSDQEPYTEVQKEIILGSLLGDGGVYRNKRWNCSPYFAKSQSGPREEYIVWHHRMFGGHSAKLGRTPPTLKIIHGKETWTKGSARFSTRQSWHLLDWRNKWYPEGVKIVPKDIVLTPLALAVWYADDGHNKAESRSVRFHTNGFQMEEVEFLRGLLLKQFNLKTRLSTETHKSGKIGYVIDISGIEPYFDFMEIIKLHFIWECFQYKISTEDYTQTTASKYCRKIEIDGAVKFHVYINKYNEIFDTEDEAVETAGARLVCDLPVGMERSWTFEETVAVMRKAKGYRFRPGNNPDISWEPMFHLNGRNYRLKPQPSEGLAAEVRKEAVDYFEKTNGQIPFHLIAEDKRGYSWDRKARKYRVSFMSHGKRKARLFLCEEQAKRFVKDLRAKRDVRRETQAVARKAKWKAEAKGRVAAAPIAPEETTQLTTAQLEPSPLPEKGIQEKLREEARLKAILLKIKSKALGGIFNKGGKF